MLLFNQTESNQILNVTNVNYLSSIKDKKMEKFHNFYLNKPLLFGYVDVHQIDNRTYEGFK